MSVDATAEPRRRQVRLAPEARRRQIVQEATRLIAQSGFNAVTLADIGDACGIRPPSVLHYFPSMNDLLAAVLIERDAESYGAGEYLGELREREEVRAFLRNVVAHSVETPEVVRLFAVLGAEALDPEHPAHEYFTERTRLALLELEKMLSWKPNPRVAAVELLAFWQGLEMLWVSRQPLDYLEVWDSFCDRFFA